MDLAKITASLEEMSSADIRSLIEAAQSALKNAEEAERGRALEEMSAVAEKYGIPLNELSGMFAKQGAKPRTSGSDEPIRFADPHDARRTWTGRGRMPSWLKAHKENGGDPEDFRVAP